MNVINFLESAAPGGNLIMLGTLGVMFVVMYFLIIRPQNKERKKVQEMINALKKGDKVVTIGGIYGTVSSLKEKTVILKVDDNCKIEMSRNSISSVISVNEKAEKAEEASKEETK
jgi:preprotein translocase, yajC subunit